MLNFFEIALCNTIDFDDDSPIAEGGGILTCLPHPQLGEPPRTPLDETILGLKVEVERLVEELVLVNSRAELSSSAHVATVACHAEERAALMSQVMQKAQLFAISKREMKALTVEMDACNSTCKELRGLRS